MQRPQTLRRPREGHRFAAFSWSSFVACVPVLLSGCLAFVGPADRDTGVRDLVKARALWNTNGVADYEVVMRKDCFCIGGGERFLYTVRSNAVTSVVRLSTGAVDSLMAATTSAAPIELAFDLLDRAVEHGAAHLEVSYDNQWGFPRMLSIDFSTGVADDEIDLHLESFTALSR
ncbi:MAG: hypothetical protein H7066_16055 [Cytophagaceae bacterium]|nr:hypothetical protein [Gemmatimonadaceae bacterium]